MTMDEALAALGVRDDTLRPDEKALLDAQGYLWLEGLFADQVEAFRARSQRLPNSLDEVTFRLPGVRFVRSSNRLYQLIAYTRAGDAVLYDSSSPAREFESITPAWAAGGGS